jgi:hypothetical protein
MEFSRFAGRDITSAMKALVCEVVSKLGFLLSIRPSIVDMPRKKNKAVTNTPKWYLKLYSFHRFRNLTMANSTKPQTESQIKDDEL